MNRKMLAGIVCLLLALLGAGAAVAEEAEAVEVAGKAGEIEVEDRSSPAAAEQAAEALGSEELEVPAAETVLTCTCDCVCPASGASETQTVPVPLWIAGCGQYNGDRCAVKLETCNTPRRYENCRL